MVFSAAKYFERTIKSELVLTGTMALSGRPAKLRIKPAEAGTGIQFLRADKPENKALVKASWNHVSKIQCNYSLINEYDVLVHRVDNILAALHYCGIDNALIEIEGSEVPFIHNQPTKFLKLIRKKGTRQQSKEKQLIWINQNIEVKVRDFFAALMPGSASRISFNNHSDAPDNGKILSFLHPSLESINTNSSQYLRQLNSIKERDVIGPYHINEVTNPDEFPGITSLAQCKSDQVNRNGIVSILSTMALTGVILIGHLYTNKPNNEILHILIDKLFNEPQNWQYLSFADFYDISRNQLQKAN